MTEYNGVDSDSSLLNLTGRIDKDDLRDEIVTICLYALQTGIMTVCTCIRYCKFKDIGLYSL